MFYKIQISDVATTRSIRARIEIYQKASLNWLLQGTISEIEYIEFNIALQESKKTIWPVTKLGKSDL